MWALQGGVYWESGCGPSEVRAGHLVGAELEPGCWEEPQAQKGWVMPPGKWSLWGLDWMGRGRPTERLPSRGGNVGWWASGQRERLECAGGQQGLVEVDWGEQWTVGFAVQPGQRVWAGQREPEKMPWLHPEPPSEDYHTHTDCGQHRWEDSHRQNLCGEKENGKIEQPKLPSDKVHHKPHEHPWLLV